MLLKVAMKTIADLYFGVNVKFLRERKGLSQDELSQKLSMTRAKIAAYEINHTKNPALKDINILSDFFSISVDVLLKLELSKLPVYKLKMVEEGKLTGADMRVIVTTVTSDNKENIEFVPVKARAGYLTGYADPDFISTLPTFDLPHLPKGKKYRMFSTQGDSMLPIPDGALIVGEYIEDWLGIKDGQLCIVVTKTDGIVFKEVINNIRDKRNVLLRSLNSIYESYTVIAEDIIEIWKYKCFISESVPQIDDCSVRKIYEEIMDVKTDLKKIIKKVNA
jgi:transcriptional regulator with XRE-family HTH domain